MATEELPLSATSLHHHHLLLPTGLLGTEAPPHMAQHRPAAPGLAPLPSAALGTKGKAEGTAVSQGSSRHHHKPQDKLGAAGTNLHLHNRRAHVAGLINLEKLQLRSSTAAPSSARPARGGSTEPREPSQQHQEAPFLKGLLQT